MVSNKGGERTSSRVTNAGRGGTMSGTHQHLDLERLARILAMGGSEPTAKRLRPFARLSVRSTLVR